jgi:hypothetical protein
MHQRLRAYDNFQNISTQTVVSSTSYFQEGEEPQSGACFFLKPWCIIGMPAFLENPGKNQDSEMKIKNFN